MLFWQGSVAGMLPRLPYDTILDAHTMSMIALVFCSGVCSLVIYLLKDAIMAGLVKRTVLGLSVVSFLVINIRLALLFF